MFRIVVAFQNSVNAAAQLYGATTHVEPLHLEGHNGIVAGEVEVFQSDLDVFDFDLLIADLVRQIMLPISCFAGTMPEWPSGRGACFQLHRIRPIVGRRSLRRSLPHRDARAGSA
ncbi:hypothetical protein FQZ97_967950 [compost metagenome]